MLRLLELTRTSTTKFALFKVVQLSAIGHALLAPQHARCRLAPAWRMNTALCIHLGHVPEVGAVRDVEGCFIGILFRLLLL